MYGLTKDRQLDDVADLRILREEEPVLRQGEGRVPDQEDAQRVQRGGRLLSMENAKLSTWDASARSSSLAR